MKEIFNQVIEKEKNADSKIAEAKEKASAFLLDAETENREKIKQYRETLQTQAKETMETFAESVKEQENRRRRERERQWAEELERKNELVDRCAEKVFAILIGRQRE